MTWEGLSPPYSTIVADPPWAYVKKVSGGTRPTVGRWASWKEQPLPYSMMALEDIRALPVGDLAAVDSWCFLWTTSRYLPEAFGVLTAWGFTYSQTLVWHKTGDPSPFGPELAPNHAEFILLGKRGSPPVLERWSGSVVQYNRSRRHSEKPALFADLIERSAPAPRVELFARQPRLGWDHWGHGYEGAGVKVES